MEALGYIFAIAIGITLGLIGGGGSILTIPVLVYFFKVEPVLAGGYSLFVVGISSLIGVVPKFKQHFVNLRTALVFGIPSLISVSLTRSLLLPAIPHELFTIQGHIITRSAVMMLLFAALMLAASRSMIRSGNREREPEGEQSPQNLQLIAQGAVIGLVTGFLGAGGGFLIIPALVMFSKLPMKTAVGTSLLIIAINSILGFFSNWSVAGESVDWVLLLSITGLAIAGILVGNFFAWRVNSASLKKGFGYFVLVMGMVIIVNEAIQILR